MLCSGLPGPGRITFPSPQLFQYRRRVMHRSDPKRAFLVQQQTSELGPEDAHRVFQQRLKYRLQFTGDLMTLRTSALANNCSKASSRFPTSRATSSFGPAATELRPLLRCMAAPFDRCTAYFGAPFHTHTLGCGQTIVVRLAGTLEAGPGIPRSECMRRRLM